MTLETASAYLRLAVTLEPAPGGGKPRPFSAPAVRGMLGKALVDRYCPFGHPHCDQKGQTPNSMKRPSSASAGEGGRERGERSGTPRSTPAGAGGAGPQRPPTPAERCHLAEACPYGVLYAASRTRRPPYALYVPPADSGEDSSRGAGNPGGPPAGSTGPTVELTLYGPAWRTYPWALHALADALADRADRADGGTGWRIAAVARLRPDRSREELFSDDLRDLPADLAPDLLGLHPEPFLAPVPVTVELLSPTHLLLKGKPVPRDRPVPFELLVKSTLDRFAGLYGADASHVLAPEIRSVVKARAAEVPLLEQDVRPVERSHHSTRSQADVDLGGTLGRLTYGPPAAAFFHLLQAAEVLHLGKNPTFGCGRVQVELQEPEPGPTDPRGAEGLDAISTLGVPSEPRSR